MTVTHPVAEMAELIEKAFDAIENGTIPEGEVTTGDANNHTWFPKLKIEETDENYVVKVTLTGVDPDEMQVVVRQGNILLATANASNASGEGEFSLYDFAKEIDEANMKIEDMESYGEHVSLIPLPPNVDASETVADFVEDVLEIDLPKLSDN